MNKVLFSFPSRLSRDSFEVKREWKASAKNLHDFLRSQRHALLCHGLHPWCPYDTVVCQKELKRSKLKSLRIIIGITLTVLALCRLWEALDLNVWHFIVSISSKQFSKKLHWTLIDHTANISIVKITLFNCVRISTVISL